MRQALRIAAVYLVLSAAWIWFSDQAVDVLADTPAQLSRLQTLKGWFFVLGSAALVWALVWREVRLVKQEEGRYRSLIEHAPDAIFVTVDGRIRLANRECLRLFGARDADELVGRTSLEFFHPDDHGTIRDRTRVILEEGKAVPSAEEQVVRLDGTVVPVAVRAAPFTYGDTHGIHVILRDITQQKAADAAIKALNAELAQRVEERTAQLAARNRELETFTYSVSHDLKTPLRGLDGYSRLLLSDHAHALDDEGRHFVERIRTAAEQMGHLIEDLLAYSRLERSEIQVGPVALRPLVETIVSGRESEVRERGIRLVLDVPEVTVAADATGLALVLRNLVDNALKFTRDAADPEVAVTARRTDAGHLLEVRDNGIGFDMRFHDRLFHLFERLQPNDDYPGTGIGLAMAPQSHGTDGGAALGAGPSRCGRLLLLGAPRVSRARPILLVEDNPMDVDLTLRAFRRRNLEIPVHVARDGDEALAWIPLWEAGETRPCVVLLDMKLPKVGGLEVLTALKGHPTLRTIPVVLLTSSGREEDVSRAYALGANSYIQKPVDFDRWVEVVTQLEAYWSGLNLAP